MAKVKNNIVISGLAGAVGRQIVFRRGKGGQTIVSNMPVFDPERERSPAQKAHHEAFQQAAAYARSAKKLAIYVARAEGTPLNPYNVALKDWFHAPEIQELDVSGWDGGAGGAIRIRAVDDIQVVEVSVVIGDGNGTVFEQGVA